MNAWGERQSRTPRALAATLACVLMVSCGRWGSHIGIPPIYIGDVFITIGIVHVAVSRMFLGFRPTTGIAKRGHPGIAVGALLGWTLIRYLVSEQHGLDALRDFAPYAYAVVAFLSARSYACSLSSDRMRTLRFLEVALIVHMLWVMPGRLVYLSMELTQYQWYPFVPRPDADGTILGVTACLFLMRFLRTGGARRLLVVIISLGSMSLMGSRASLLASITGLAVTVWCYLHVTHGGTQHSARRQLAMLGLAPFVLVTVLVSLPQTSSGSKLLVSIGAKHAESPLDASGLGTKRARSNTWQQVIAYVQETPNRTLVGVGFGPNIMLESGGSIALLSGNAPDVRSPHNYLIGTYARLGIVGIVLFGLVIVAMLAGIIQACRQAASDDLILLAVLVPPMILIEAVFGVVLETPFGAIPFFWFLGILLTKPLALATPDQAGAGENEPLDTAGR